MVEPVETSLKFLSLLTILYSLFSTHYSLLTIHYSLFSILYSLLTILYSLFTILYSLFTILYSLFTILYSLFTILYSLLKTFPQIQVLVSYTAWIISKSSNDFAYKNISKNGYNKKRITAYLKNLIEKQSLLFKWLHFECLHINSSSGLLTNNELWKNLLYTVDFIMCLALLYN